jgi:hypothetical protein
MNKLEQIRTELAYRPEQYMVSNADVRLLLEYVEAAEAVPRNRCDCVGCSKIEDARLALGLEPKK